MNRSEKAELLFRIAEDVTGVTRSDITSKKRNKETIDVRKICMYILYNEGYYESQLSEIFNCSRTRVKEILHSFEESISDDVKYFDRQLYLNYSEVLDIFNDKLIVI